jgi:hypothetical protein
MQKIKHNLLSNHKNEKSLKRVTNGESKVEVPV